MKPLENTIVESSGKARPKRQSLREHYGKARREMQSLRPPAKRNIKNF